MRGQPVCRERGLVREHLVHPEGVGVPGVADDVEAQAAGLVAQGAGGVAGDPGEERVTVAGTDPDRDDQ